MKKLLLFLTILSIFSACKKDDDYVFNQSPDERVNTALASYQSTLTGAENGWKALITVNGGTGGTYSFYFKFDNSNRVKMVSDFDSASAATLQESSYRLKAQQQPTLIFDTYSYVHVLADPNENVVVSSNVNGGPVGQGLLSDFEFIIDAAKVRADTIELTGKVNNSKLMLVKATKAEGDAFNAGQLAAGFNINKILTYFKRLTIGSQLIDVQITPGNRSITFTWIEAGGAVRTYTTTYYLSVGGISLTNPLTIGSLTIKSLDNISWNPATQTVSFLANNTAATITGIVVPLKVDLTAPRRWWQFAINNGNTYWISANGFHVNGVDDAFNIKTLNRYFYLIYWPEYDPGNDLFAPVFINDAGTGLELQYGAAPETPAFTAGGLAKFTLLGNYGTYPTNGPARLSLNQLLIPEGYYFVQTGESRYDMVSAADGKAWITWEF